MATQTSRAWFPGLLIPLNRLTRFEALSHKHSRIQVQVGRDTVFGTPAQALATGLALVRAAVDADPDMAAQVTDRQLRVALGA
jgi:hypothetical protein